MDYTQNQAEKYVLDLMSQFEVISQQTEFIGNVDRITELVLDEGIKVTGNFKKLQNLTVISLLEAGKGNAVCRFKI